MRSVHGWGTPVCNSLMEAVCVHANRRGVILTRSAHPRLPGCRALAQASPLTAGLTDLPARASTARA